MFVSRFAYVYACTCSFGRLLHCTFKPPRPPSFVLPSVSCLGLMLTLSSWDLVRYFHNRSEMQNEWKPAAQYVHAV
jgi:hypothetical protein